MNEKMNLSLLAASHCDSNNSFSFMCEVSYFNSLSSTDERHNSCSCALCSQFSLITRKKVYSITREFIFSIKYATLIKAFSSETTIVVARLCVEVGNESS